jgi:hypothetical protein
MRHRSGLHLFDFMSVLGGQQGGRALFEFFGAGVDLG